MTKITRLTLIFTTIVAAGCATDTSPSANLGRTVPSLKVVTDCGSCQVRLSVPVLIEDSYKAAASKAGVKVMLDTTATLTIKEYDERSDTARMLAGALAGKDEIKAVAQYKEKSFAIEDYYRNAWQGMESLAKKIGEMTYDEISKLSN